MNALRTATTEKALEQAVAGVLKPLGYAKRAATWHRDRGLGISVLNLQKSRWGEDWYLNLGVYLKALGDETRPPESRCHVRCRATALAGSELPRDSGDLAALVAEVAAPWLETVSTEQGVAGFLASKDAHPCMVDQRVRESLNVPADTRRRNEVTPPVTPQVTPQVALLHVLHGEMSRRAVQDALGLGDTKHFRQRYLLPALEAGWIEMTHPDKPNSRLQKYRLTPAGSTVLAEAGNVESDE